MEFKLIINPDRPEEITAAVHARSDLTDRIEALVLRYSGADKLTVYARDEVRQLPFSQIECLTVIDGRTWAVDGSGDKYQVKMRLYELESMLPACFIRINRSTLANEKRLERFSASFSGAVDAVFRCGYREYVSRRCFAQIKRRFST